MVFIVVSRRFASDRSKGHAAAIEWLGAGFNRARAVRSLAHAERTLGRRLHSRAWPAPRWLPAIRDADERNSQQQAIVAAVPDWLDEADVAGDAAGEEPDPVADQKPGNVVEAGGVTLAGGGGDLRQQLHVVGDPMNDRSAVDE